MRITIRKWGAGLVVAAVIMGVGLAVPAGSAAAAYSPGYTFADVQDWDHDGHQDVIARDRGGRMWLYPGGSVRGYSPVARKQIGHGWSAYTLDGIVDWDHDGHQDIVARDRGGRMWLYPGRSVRGYSYVRRVQIGYGWSTYTVAGIADWDSDGHQDIVARDRGGRMWLYAGQSVLGYSTAGRYQIGYGFGAYTVADIADWDADGHQDIVARDSSGHMWLYSGQSVRRYSYEFRARIGHGWHRYTVAGIADWDTDGHQDIIARDDHTGGLWLYPGRSQAGVGGYARVPIGRGW